MRHVRDPREVAARERRDELAVIHAAHDRRKAAEQKRWVAEAGAVVERYRERLAVPVSPGRAATVEVMAPAGTTPD